MLKKSSAAFSLLETLLVLALIIVLFGLGIFAYRNFYQSATLDSTAQEVVSALREAQQNAMSGKDDASWGVQFLADRYTLFAGSDAASSTNKRAVLLDQAMTFTALNFSQAGDSISFQKLTGDALSYGSLKLVFREAQDSSQVISISRAGAIQANIATQ